VGEITRNRLLGKIDL